MPDKRRRAKKLTEREIVEQSKIEPETDVEEARRWWRGHAPAQYKELLDAKEQPDERA